MSLQCCAILETLSIMYGLYCWLITGVVIGEDKGEGGHENNPEVAAPVLFPPDINLPFASGYM